MKAMNHNSMYTNAASFYCNIQLLGIDQVSRKVISNMRAALFLCIQRLANTCGILEAKLHL